MSTFWFSSSSTGPGVRKEAGALRSGAPVSAPNVLSNEGSGLGNAALGESDLTNRAAANQVTTPLMTGQRFNRTNLSPAETAGPPTPGLEIARARKPALRLVEDAPAYVDEIRYEPGESHSLHDLDLEPSRMQPLLARSLIERFSARSEAVLDPCARFGTAALEANLLGRDGRGAETHPVLASICGAKITPADIAEVALMCQTVGMRRPVGIESFRQHFSAHYDVETYRELVTLRGLLGDSQSRTVNAVRALALSLLHGPSAGYFSVAAPVATAFAVDHQHAFNIQRRQRPDYRAVLPRLLKRAASISRDGIPSFASRSRRKTVGTLLLDPRRLEGIETASVDFVIGEPMLPLQADRPGEASWVRNWFVDVAPQASSSVDAWLAWLNESLLEWARVLRPGRRVAMVLGSFEGEPAPELLVGAMVRQALGRFFAVEGIIIESARADVVRGSRSRAAGEDIVGSARVLVLKRR